MRPLAAVLAAVAATDGGDFVLDGTPRMRERPIEDLIDGPGAASLFLGGLFFWTTPAGRRATIRRPPQASRSWAAP